MQYNAGGIAARKLPHIFYKMQQKDGMGGTDNCQCHCQALQGYKVRLFTHNIYVPSLMAGSLGYTISIVAKVTKRRNRKSSNVLLKFRGPSDGISVIQYSYIGFQV